MRHPDGTFVPGVPHQDVLKLMGEFEADLHAELASLERDWSALSAEQRLQNAAVIVGLAVASLVRIHPFVNGNGRTSRILWGVLLSRLGLPVAMAVVKRPGHPYGAVMDAAMRGDSAPAIALVLAGIAQMTPPEALQISAET